MSQENVEIVRSAYDVFARHNNAAPFAREKVLVHQQNAVRGRTSGADVELDHWVVASFREGKILRDQWFADRAEALEAVGLSE